MISIDAGAGDDIIYFDKNDSHIDGGDGTDTLMISDSVLDFSNITNGTIENIERLDLSNNIDQTVSLNLRDVLDMTGTDNVLEVTGEAGDIVTINAHGWTENTASPGLFTNDISGHSVTIVSSADSGADIQIDFTDDGTSVG